jgi:hypothetical protein
MSSLRYDIVSAGHFFNRQGIPIKFLINHWQGKLPLQVSLWLVFIGLLVLLSSFEPFLLTRLVSNPELRVFAAIVSLVITRFIIFPWQLVGLFRATENDYIKHGNTIKNRSIQALMVLSVLYTLVYTLESMQAVIFNNEYIHFLAKDKNQSEYTLKIENEGQQLHIKGIFDFGITDSVRKVINDNPELTSVVLESAGGQVYEGRGLSLLITKHEFDTYSYQECSSACATAFIGGKRRYLGHRGKIGFHRYRLESVSYWNYLPYLDIHSEQDKDLTLFKSKGVEQTFLDKVFDQTHNKMWFPAQQDLIDAGVIHELLEP